jgi:hypothetical protein
MKQRYSVLCVCLASLVAVSAGADRAVAQQGVYVTQASARLTKLIDASNKQGYALQNNSFSIGGGWLKQSQTAWIPIYSIKLTAGKTYRFLAAGDNDARDVDLDIQDSTGKTLKADVDTAAEAVVEFTPTETAVYRVRLRLYASENNVDCVCLGIVMVKK